MRFLLLFALGLVSHAEIVSYGIGMVQGEAITSREVQISNLLGQALDLKAKPTVQAGTLALSGKAFKARAQENLREAAIALEAQNFNVIQILPEEQASFTKQVKARLKNNEAWKNLKVSEVELDRELRRKILARKFIHFREQNSVLPLTDADAEREYKDNRKKYGEKTFAQAKDEIKSNLSQAQVEARMKDWYDGIDNKYHVKSLILENE